MSYAGVNWFLRRRACRHFGHKSALPCVRCGIVREDEDDISAYARIVIVPVVVEYVMAPSPLLRYLKRHV